MRLWIALFLALLVSPAAAQSVQQSGSVTPGHPAMWSGTGIIKDAGTAANGFLSTLGVTNNGGPGICVASAASTAAGRNQLCLAATTNGGTKISSYIYGTATNPGIVFDINGTVQGFPTVTLPVVSGDIVCFDGTTGTLRDCGTTPGLIPPVGTAGGIPYYATSTSLLSSAMLTLNGPVIGGGSGGAPSTVTPGTNNLAFMGNTGAAPGFRAINATDLATPAPSYPVRHPSSGNIVGPGCGSLLAHALGWNDQNACATADARQITSTDPSAAFSLTLSGSVTVGDIISLTFVTGSGLCSGAGCTITSGAATGGDTLQTLANKLVCAIANNASLLDIGDGSCVGAAGVVSGTFWGGYASGNPIGYVVLITNGVALDFNSVISMKITSSVSGAATEIVTIANTTCSVRCSYALDNNPRFELTRISGAAPQPGSTLAQIDWSGATSGCATTACISYGSLSVWVGNSTAGAIHSAFLLATPNINASLAGGLLIGQGAFTNDGGAPLSASGTADMGIGTFNASQAYWLNGVHKIAYTGSAMTLTPAAGFSVLMTVSGTAGVGINTTPTASGEFNSAIGGFFSGAQIPTTGTGVAIGFGGGNGYITSENFGTTTFQQLSLNASIIQLAPNGVGAQGFAAQSNAFFPNTDNAEVLGATNKRWLNTYSVAFTGSSLVLNGATSGTHTQTPPAIAGSAAVVWGTASGTPAVTASSPLAITTATGNITCPTCTTNAASLTANDIVVGGGSNAIATGTGCSISSASIICSTSASAFPQFFLTNTAADANSAAFIFQKSRSVGNTLASDSLYDMQVQPYANASYRISGRMQFLQTAASSGNNVPTKIVFSTSNTAGQVNQALTFDSAAHISITQATAPSLTAGCNGAGSSVSGNDYYGTVTGQTAAATTCTLTFGTAFAAAPACTATGLTSPLTGAVTPGTGTLVVNFASTATYKFTYSCPGA